MEHLFEISSWLSSPVGPTGRVSVGRLVVGAAEHEGPASNAAPQPPAPLRRVQQHQSGQNNGF